MPFSRSLTTIWVHVCVLRPLDVKQICSGAFIAVSYISSIDYVGWCEVGSCSIEATGS